MLSCTKKRQISLQKQEISPGGVCTSGVWVSVELVSCEAVGDTSFCPAPASCLGDIVSEIPVAGLMTVGTGSLHPVKQTAIQHNAAAMARRRCRLFMSSGGMFCAGCWASPTGYILKCLALELIRGGGWAQFTGARFYLSDFTEDCRVRFEGVDGLHLRDSLLHKVHVLSEQRYGRSLERRHV